MKLFFSLTLFLGLAWLLSVLIVNLLWPVADKTPRGRAWILNPFKRLSFLFGLLWIGAADRLSGQRLAINAVLTPHETTRGTQSMDADAVVSFNNAVVIYGSDDRHFALPAGATNIPLGILFNDAVTSGDVGSVRKQIAIFGLYAESLPGVAAAAIAVGAELVADLATPGRVKTLPSASGTYVVFGRARYAVATAADPVSIIHCVPRVVVIP